MTNSNAIRTLTTDELAQVSGGVKMGAQQKLAVAKMLRAGAQILLDSPTPTASGVAQASYMLGMATGIAST